MSGFVTLTSFFGTSVGDSLYSPLRGCRFWTSGCAKVGRWWKLLWRYALMVVFRPACHRFGSA